MNTYRTAQVAEMIGIHPNTVRLYEKLQLIPAPERSTNGYRIFTDLHIDLFRLARTAFQIEVLQNGLRKKIVSMIKTATAGDFDRAISMTEEYLSQLQTEQENANEAINIVKKILSRDTLPGTLQLKRNETARLLQISMDTLRNWEMNGLVTIKRKKNGYRIYTSEDIDRLKIIRSLRCANYSLEAILRMLSALSRNPDVDIEQALETPEPDDEIVGVCDKLLTSLQQAAANGKRLRQMLREIKNKY